MKKRGLFIAGNWKMNLNLNESLQLAETVVKGTSTFDNIKVSISPNFVSLVVVSHAVEDSAVMVAAQDCHFEESGAYTGETAAEMIKSAGAGWVIVGHSERRTLFGEDDEIVAKKLKNVLRNDLKPIVCIGESLEEREAGIHKDVIRRQLDYILETASDLTEIVIAYEPVWAIGTGKTAAPEQAEEMHKYIRELIKNSAGENISESILILYGGSVSLPNAKELLSSPNIDGALIGGASLKADSFIGIAEIAEELSKE